MLVMFYTDQTVLRMNADGFALRCMNAHCGFYKQYYSIRKNSFFEKLNVSLTTILSVVL